MREVGEGEVERQLKEERRDETLRVGENQISDSTHTMPSLSATCTCKSSNGSTGI